MKLTFTMALMGMLMLMSTGCTKSDSNNGGNTNACASVNSFTVTQVNDKINININCSYTPLYFELSTQSASSNPDPNFGYMTSLSGTNTSIALSDAGVNTNGGLYVFYVRAICASDSRSNWSTAQAVTIAPYCISPSNITMNSGTLSWNTNGGNNSTHQVQYGPTGFAIGSGTTINASNTWATNFVMNYNSTYDFYVRTFCPSGNAWSGWVGPVSYTNLQNACNLPTNLSRQIESVGTTYTTVSLRWSSNGGTDFEYMVVTHGSPIANATIYSATNTGWPVVQLNRSYTYDFYMRTVCSDGSRTAWTTPYLISNL